MTDLRRKELKRTRELVRYYRKKGYVIDSSALTSMSTRKLKTITSRDVKKMATAFRLPGLKEKAYDIPISEWREAEYYRLRSSQISKRYKELPEAPVKALIPSTLEHFRDYVEGVKKRANPEYRDARNIQWYHNYLKPYARFMANHPELKYIHDKLVEMGPKKVVPILRKVEKGSTRLDPLTYIDSDDNFLIENLSAIYATFGIEPYDGTLDGDWTDLDEDDEYPF